MLQFFSRRLPDDVWLVDLDSNKITPSSNSEEIVPLPEPEGTVLKNHLRQVKLIYNIFKNYILLVCLIR